jgi:hypothetical protein
MSNEMMRNIIGQTKSAFNLRDIMDSGKILLVNLSRGRTGNLNSQLLGMIFVMKFEVAAMSRADVPEEYRRDFCLYVDEFQNFATDSFAHILSEARKYHLNLVVANQFSTQLKEEVRDAVFGNVGSVISFRVGTEDAEFLAKQYQPVFDIDDLQFLPNYKTAVRMMIGGVPVQPFSMATLPPLGNPNKQLADALKQLSAAKHGRPKATVESEIFKRLETQQRPALGAGQPLPSGPAGPWPPSALPSSRPALQPPSPGASAQSPKPSTGSSVLDEWLAKRKPPTLQSGPRPGSVRAAAPPSSSAMSTPWGAKPVPPGPGASTPWAASSTAPRTSPPPPAPKQPAAPEPMPSIKNEDGEFKIKQDLDASQHPETTVRIDKDGNISYVK